MIEYDNGIHLKGTGLWFDSKKKVGLSFISNADIDKFTPPEKIIATHETIKFLEKKVKRSVLLTCPFYRPFSLGNLQVELIPSGHMLGSAQIIVDKSEKTLIYSGDINLKELPTAESISIKHCNVLVLKCSFGLPEYIFPKFEESMKPLIKFIEAALSSDSTPILKVKAMGMAQDIIKALGESGFKLTLHKSIYDVTKIYEGLGINFGDYEILEFENIEEKVVIMPLEKIDSDNLHEIKSKQSAIIIESGTEELSSIASEFNADKAFTFSTRAGYDELLEYVEKVNPEKVYLIDKYANEFAKTLQNNGYEAIALEKPTQLNLL